MIYFFKYNDIILKNSKNIILPQLQNIVQEDQYYHT